MPIRCPSENCSHRSASALILVLVVIVMLTLGAYTFSELMITEYQASDAYARRVQSQMWAESGVDYVAALLTPDGGGFDSDLYDDPGLFHVALDPGAGFSIVAPRESSNSSGIDSQASSDGLRFGLVDECAKLNINVLANFNPDDNTARNMLMELPNMTEAIADSILDWIDADDEQREYGAESESYSTVFPRNGPIDSLEELMLVLGVEPSLMYGEDANRNGILDPNENDGELSLPADNEDGILDLGWAAYLTTYSVEGNYRHSYDMFGEERINVNEPLLTDLYDTLLNEFDEETALFVTAYRLNGPNEDLSALEDLGAGGTTGSGENPLNGVGSGSTRSTGDFETDMELEQAASSIAKSLFSGSGGSITRGGLDLSAGSSTEIRSLYDLIDAEVDVEIDGTMTTLASPWLSDPGELQATLPLLLDSLTVSSESVIRGRININQARPEVMRGIPNMPLDLPDAIVAARARTSGSSTTLDQYSTTGWLLIQGLVDLQTMRSLDGFLTTRGDVFRMQVVGHADRGGPVTRIEAVVDATQDIPRVIFQRTLSELGPGYRANQLIPFGE